MPPHPPATLTPAGVQSLQDLARRRSAFALGNVAIYVALGLWMASLLSASGWSLLNLAILACFLLVAPWSVLGLGNAVLGLWLLHGARDGFLSVAPYAAAGDSATPLQLKTAIVMTLRNEDPARAFTRLRAVQASVEAAGFPDSFDCFILSDSSDHGVAALEEAAFADWRRTSSRIFYRRRTDNTGFKAGNLRAFCAAHGSDYTFLLPLDADSLMSGETVARMVRICQAHPRIGILQSLVVGAPSSSAFARLFQFGMRHGMRPYSVGSAWWSGDCGQFWGHNALVRIAPFRDHCDLPALKNGLILSHDQIEAALMRRAGFEVRVLPVETGSYEDNPPDLLEFCRRDQRWCLGNMQYLQLLQLPGLLPASRFQLVWAVAMFIGLPAFNILLVLLAAKAAAGAVAPPGAAAFYWVFLVLLMLPKLAGFADVALSPGGLARHGGAARFFLGALCELVFSFLTSAIAGFGTALFLLMLPFGRTTTWNGQARDAQTLAWGEAALQLWPATLFGLALAGLLASGAPALLPWALPYVAGLVLAVPVTVLSARPGLGAWLRDAKICAIPEEFDPPEVLRRLAAMEDSPR